MRQTESGKKKAERKGFKNRGTKRIWSASASAFLIYGFYRCLLPPKADVSFFGDSSSGGDQRRNPQFPHATLVYSTESTGRSGQSHAKPGRPLNSRVRCIFLLPSIGGWKTHDAPPRRLVHKLHDLHMHNYTQCISTYRKKQD